MFVSLNVYQKKWKISVIDRIPKYCMSENFEKGSKEITLHDQHLKSIFLKNKCENTLIFTLELLGQRW